MDSCGVVPRLASEPKARPLGAVHHCDGMSLALRGGPVIRVEEGLDLLGLAFW